MTWYFDKKTLGFPNSDASGERTVLIPDPDWVYDPERDEDTTPPLVRIANPDCKLPPDEQLIALSEEDYRYLFDGITRGMRAVLDENQKPILIAAPQAPPLTQEAVEANRMRAYAHPITGTDRLFSEVLRMQNMGESDWEVVRDKAIERFNEIQVQFPWPEENTRKQYPPSHPTAPHCGALSFLEHHCMSTTSRFHGVTVTLVDTGARVIALPSTSIIGLVDTFTPGETATAQPNDLVLLTSEREAVAAFGDDSAITRAAKAVFIRAKAVIVACGVAKLDDPALQTSAIIGGVLVSGQRTGLQALLDGKSRFNAQPRLLIAPKHSATQAVATAMDALAGKLRAIAIIDGPNTTDEAVLAYAKEFGSKRVFMVDPGVQQWDTLLNKTVDAPASAFAAGLFAWTDTEYGFWASPSNKELVGITGTTRPIEFLDGDETCRANLLNNANITTIIRDGGYRLWGNRTLSADAKWSFVTRVRTLDIVMDAILYGHKWAVDRSITKTYVKDVTEGLQAFMRDLKNQGAVINFEVFADPELNTASQLEQGKVYWNIRFTDVPPAENPNFRVEVTNQWLTEVLETTA